MPTLMIEMVKTALEPIMLLSTSLLVITDTLDAFPVIDTSFLRVRQYIICLRNILEFSLRQFWIIRIFIRVELNCLLFESSFDLFV